jgi:hypothetical protein
VIEYGNTGKSFFALLNESPGSTEVDDKMMEVRRFYCECIDRLSMFGAVDAERVIMISMGISRDWKMCMDQESCIRMQAIVLMQVRERRIQGEHRQDSN